MKLVEEPGQPARPEVLTLSEAAQLLRMSEGRVRQMIAEGRLPAFRTGPGARSRIRVWRHDLERAASTSFAPQAREERAREAAVRIEQFFAADRPRHSVPVDRGNGQS